MNSLIKKSLIFILPALMAAGCNFGPADNKPVQPAEDPSKIFDLQDKCSKDAQAFFQSSYVDKMGYINHYNKTLNKCFIKEFSISDIVETFLYDVQDKTLYGDLSGYYNYDDPAHTNLKITTCEVNGQKCSSESQFNTLIGSYMSN